MRHFMYTAIMAATLAAVGFESQAFAQVNAADELFKEGKRLLTAKDYAAACPKFEASAALDPTVGVTLYLADCYESWGKLASAWRAFDTAARRGKESDDKRATIATGRRDALTPRLAKIRVMPMDDAADAVMTLDDRPVDASEYAEFTPIDAGAHTIAVKRKGYKDWRETLRVADGEEYKVVVALEPVNKGTTGNPGTPPTGEPSDGGSDGPSGLAIVGGIAGGVGVAGIIVGAILTADAASTRDDAVANDCQGGTSPLVCTQAGADSIADAESTATLGSGLLIGGSILAAGGLTMFVIGLVSSGSSDDAGASTPAMPWHVAASPTPGGFFVEVGGKF